VNVLVFLEHHGGELAKGPLGVLAKGAAIGNGEVAAVLVGGEPLDALAAQAGKFGATTVHVAHGDALDPPLPQPCVDVLDAVVRAGLAGDTGRRDRVEYHRTQRLRQAG